MMHCACLVIQLENIVIDEYPTFPSRVPLCPAMFIGLPISTIMQVSAITRSWKPVTPALMIAKTMWDTICCKQLNSTLLTLSWHNRLISKRKIITELLESKVKYSNRAAILWKFIRDYLTNDDTHRTSFQCHNIESYIWAFRWNAYICPSLIVKVKVKHIYTVSIWEFIKDGKNITIVIK